MPIRRASLRNLQRAANHRAVYLLQTHTHTHSQTVKNFYYRLPLSSGRDGQIPGGMRTLLSISLLPREVWMTKSSVSVRPSHSLIRRRASSPAELTFLGERMERGKHRSVMSALNQGDSITRVQIPQEYNRFTQYHCDKHKCKCFTFHESLNLQTSHPLTCINIWIY